MKIGRGLTRGVREITIVVLPAQPFEMMIWDFSSLDAAGNPAVFTVPTRD